MRDEQRQMRFVVLDSRGIEYDLAKLLRIPHPLQRVIAAFERENFINDRSKLMFVDELEHARKVFRRTQC